jgi:capsular exopolysaccharide synthesis family protein
MSGDGKSTVARFLAMTMADMGDDVVLVEADLHKRGMSESMVPADGGGLSRVLVEGGLDESLVEIGVGNEGDPSQRYLTVLPSGPLPPNQSELLESERMREVIRELESRYELVIIDTPPLSIVSDALSLVPEVSGVLVVSGLQHTTRDAARELTKQLALLGERPVGVVANFAAADRSGYYYQG